MSDQPATGDSFEAARKEVTARIAALASRLSTSSSPIEELASPERRIAAANAKRVENDNWLRVLYALGLFLLMLAQVVGSDYLFYRYASSKSIHWSIPTSTANVWIGATVVQIIGVVLVVVHYLFPNQDGKRTIRG